MNKVFITDTADVQKLIDEERCKEEYFQHILDSIVS